MQCILSTPPLRLTPQERYIAAAKAAGCPRDQIENFIRAGIVLQPKQLEFSACARLCDRDDGPTEVGIGGARSASKSFGVLAQAVADDMVRYPGLKGLLLRKLGKAAREQFEDLRRSVLKGVQHDYKRQEGLLLLPNGSRMIIGHFKDEADIDSYLGVEYDVIVLEETTQLSPSKLNAIRSCSRTTKIGWRARMYCPTNPGGPGHFTYKQRFVDPWQKGVQTDTRYIHVLPHDNAFTRPEYIKYLDSLTGYYRRIWRDGDWNVATGQFFQAFDREKHVCTPFEIPQTWKMWLALDYGFTHPTSAHLFAESGDGIVYVVDEHSKSGWLVERHAEAIKEMCERNGCPLHRLEALVAGEDLFSVRHTGTTLYMEYAEHDLRFRPATTDRIQRAAEALRRLGDPHGDPPIEPSVYIFDRCKQLIECLPMLVHDENVPEKVAKLDADDDSGQIGDDSYDSWSFGLLVARKQRKFRLV